MHMYTYNIQVQYVHTEWSYIAQYCRLLMDAANMLDLDEDPELAELNKPASVKSRDGSHLVEGSTLSPYTQQVC